MNQLQKELDQFIYRWQPGESTTLSIDLEHTAGDILATAKECSFIVDICNKYETKLEMWFELDEGLLQHQYDKQQAEWAREKSYEREAYYKAAM